MTEVPASYARGQADLYTLNWNSAFWVNNWVANQAYSRYSLMIDDIRKVQRDLEDNFEKQQPGIEAQALALHKTQPTAAVELLTNYSINAGQDATARYRQLGEYLFVKYLDGNVKKEKDGKFERNEAGMPVQPTWPGYTQDYYETVVHGSGDRLKVIEPEK